MRLLLLALGTVAAAVGSPVVINAQSAGQPTVALSPFAGTWCIDTSQDQFAGRPVSRLIKDGIYRCGNCVTTVEVPADGEFHPIVGGQDFDEVAVWIRGPRRVDFHYRKAGRLAETVTERVSIEGDVLSFRNVDLTAPSGKAVVAEGQRSRVGAPPPRAHPVSGEWRPLGGTKESVASLTLVIGVSEDQVTIVQPTGRKIAARVGGASVPIIGDQAERMARVEAVPPRSLRITTAIKGEDVQTGLMTVAGDGRSMTYEATDLTLDQKVRFVAIKQ